MSIPAPEDPGLTSSESEQAEYVMRGATNGAPLLAIAAGLGGAFLVYQQVMRRKLREELAQAEGATSEELFAATMRAYSSFTPAWLAMVTPLLLQGYLRGAQEAGFLVDEELLYQLAEGYAYSLGAHLNEVSADAVAKGYAAQVNRKIQPKLALANVIDSFGVTLRTMRSLNAMADEKDKPKLSEQLMPSIKKARAQQLVARAIEERAEVVGDQESWNAKQTGKQLAWIYAQRSGLIPENATREWVTAKDERVCAVCGPMHKVQVPISEPFVVEKFKTWAPPLHPRCRCEVKLKANVAQAVASNVFYADFQRRWLDDLPIAKSDNQWETQPRAKGGRFGARPDLADFDLQAMADTALINEAANRKPRLEPERKKTLEPNKRLEPKKRFLEDPKKKSPRKSLNGSSSNRMSSQGMRGQGMRTQKVDREQMKRDLRMARARMEGRIQAQLGDIPGVTVQPTQPNPKAYHEGLVSTSEPMFAIVDNGNVTQENERIRINNAEIIGGTDTLKIKIAAYEQNMDEQFIDDAYFNEMGEFGGYIGYEGPGEIELDPAAIQEAIAWTRATHQTDDLIGEMFIEVPVYQVVDQRSGEVMPDDWNYPEEMSDDDIDNYVMEPTSSTLVRASAVAEFMDLDEYVSYSTPRVIKVSLVRDNDVGYDPYGVPYAQPDDEYQIDHLEDLVINGRAYVAYALEPGWLDE